MSTTHLRKDVSGLVIIASENVIISLSSDKLCEICFRGMLGALSVLLCPETFFCLVSCSLRNMPMSRFSPSKLLQCLFTSRDVGSI